MEFTLVTTFLAILSVKKISAQNSIQRSDLKAASGWQLFYSNHIRSLILVEYFDQPWYNIFATQT